MVTINKGTILDAFERYDSIRLPMTERLEQEINLPDGVVLTNDDIVVVAAILGSLLSLEGRVNIGVHNKGTEEHFEIDTTKLRNASDVPTYVKELRQNVDQSTQNMRGTFDIEVTDEKVALSEETVIGLIIQDGGCALSVRGDCIEQDMLEHLCKITNFACEKAFNVNACVPADLFPEHPKCGAVQRKLMVERIFIQKQKSPSDLAIVDDSYGKTLTYNDLWNLSGSVAQQIHTQVKTEQSYPRIAIFMERCWKHLTSVTAIQRLQGTCVLIDVTHPDERIQGFLEQTTPDAIIASNATIDRARSLTNRMVLDFDNMITQELDVKWEGNEWYEVSNDVCFIAGTSGTTGKSKAVCLSYSGMKTTVDAIISASKLGEYSIGTWLSSPGYGMIEVDPLPVLCVGGIVCIPSPEVLQDVQMLVQWYVKNKVTHTLVMTSIAEALWANGFCTQLHTMLIAGERCKQWPNTEYRVLNVYGSAEAAVVSIADLSEPRRTLLPTVGRAVPGANMYVVDNDGKELPACCVGELVITGDTLSMGYLDAEQTEKSFHQNTLDDTSTLQYTSGDRARMGLDGIVEIFGRSDSLVKIRGHRVDLAEIEITALEVKGVAKAAVICLNDNAGAILELFIEPKPNTNDIENEVREYLKDKLHPAAQPSKIHVRELPLGINDKVDYAALRNCLVKSDTTHTSFYPTTKIETALYDCWMTWSRCDGLTLESDFYQSGGDSLRAMRMMGELNYKYGIHIEMSDFLENPVFSYLLHLANISNTTDLPDFENLTEEQQLEPFELNEYQQALWIGRGADFSYGNVGCQGYFEWEAKELDYNRFVHAVGMLVARHPMLRITIDDTGCQKMEVVDGRQAVEFIDLSKLSQNEMNTEIDKIRSHMANDEIGTKQWPLFRFVVTKISTDISRIHFCIDLLIADAWSIFQVIIPDLIEFYTNDNPDLPTIKTTFHDYTVHRRKVKQSTQYHAHREYWLQKIHELPAAPKLPQLEKKESDSLAKFARYEGTLEKESWVRLQAHAKERRISPSGIVALAFCEVLRCWSEEPQFTINLPVSDRMPVREDIDLLVGDFTNVLLVPYKTSTGDRLETRGQQLQDAIWEALDHRLFTGVEVLRELTRIRHNGREALMPIVFTSLLGHAGRHDVSLLGREVFGGSQTPQVTLDVQLRESEGMLYFKWDYLTGCIRPDVIEEMFNSFCRLLQQLVEEPDIWECTQLELRPDSQIAVRDAKNAKQQSVGEVNLDDLSKLCGSTISDCKYHIYNEDWVERPDWVIGEILVESDTSLKDEQIQQLERTQQEFICNSSTGCCMRRTGYLGRYVSNGDIEVLQQVVELPLQDNDAVNADMLNEKLLNQSDKKGSNKMDKQTIIRTIVRIISKQLDQPVVLLEDNFFELGGDSMNAMKIKNELKDQLSVTVSIESIMLTETIGELANEIVESINS